MKQDKTGKLEEDAPGSSDAASAARLGQPSPTALAGDEPGFSLDRDMIDRQEPYISPPMDFVITLPVLVNGNRSAIVIYVAASPFDLDTPPNEKAKLVSAVARALRLGGEESTSTAAYEGAQAGTRSQD